jgi:hypothetical protein
MLLQPFFKKFQKNIFLKKDYGVEVLVYFTPNLKFAPTESLTQDLRTATRAT